MKRLIPCRAGRVVGPSLQMHSRRTSGMFATNDRCATQDYTSGMSSMRPQVPDYQNKIFALGAPPVGKLPLQYMRDDVQYGNDMWGDSAYRRL